MSQRLISRSPDLRRLRDEGFNVKVRDGYLLVDDVPYLDEDGTVQRGTLVSTLDLAGEITAPPSTHVVYFTGSYPHQRNGRPIEGLRHMDSTTELVPGLVIRHAFSNKPEGGYANYFAKMTRYVEIISAQVTAEDPTASACTATLVTDDESDSVFQYVDTASSRAGICLLSPKLQKSKIAIVGMGGTASYLLDFLAKTPAREIHLFDGDRFLQHNAFRAPGAASCEDLMRAPLKVEYFAQAYSRMHRGIVAHPMFVDARNVNMLADMDFVFIAVDRGSSRRLIADALVQFKVPFIDVGLGVERSDLGLCATLRVTTCTQGRHAHLARRASMGDEDEEQPAEYTTNIQIAELNAVNAGLAVIKYKKLLGFYADEEGEYNSAMATSINLLTSDEAT